MQDEGWCVTHATSGLVAQAVSLPPEGSLPRSVSTSSSWVELPGTFVSGFGAGIWLEVQRTWPEHRRGPGDGLEQRLGSSLRQRSREMAQGGASIGGGAGPVGAGGRGGHSPGPREQQACGSMWAASRVFLGSDQTAPSACAGPSTLLWAQRGQHPGLETRPGCLRGVAWRRMGSVPGGPRCPATTHGAGPLTTPRWAAGASEQHAPPGPTAGMRTARVD